jgi:hypothetical protein
LPVSATSTTKEGFYVYISDCSGPLFDPSLRRCTGICQ